MLYLKTSVDVDITGDKTVFIIWFKLGVEGRSESLSMGDLAGERGISGRSLTSTALPSAVARVKHSDILCVCCSDTFAEYDRMLASFLWPEIAMICLASYPVNK